MASAGGVVPGLRRARLPLAGRPDPGFLRASPRVRGRERAGDPGRQL